MKKHILLLIIIITSYSFIYSIKIVKINDIILEQPKENYIQYPKNFFVTDSEYIYIHDRKAINIKIFDKNGKFIKNFGRRGAGPDEFMILGTTDYRNNKFFVNDNVRRLVFVYDTNKENSIKIDYSIKLFVNSHSMKFITNNKILIAGMYVDKYSRDLYSLYTYDITKKKVNSVIRSFDFYNVSNNNEFRNVMMDKLGGSTWIASTDFNERYFFLSNALDIDILRIDRINKKKHRFGNRTTNFIRPDFNSNDFRIARRARNSKQMKDIKKTQSFVINLFVIDNKRIGLLYTKYIKRIDQTNLFLQIYKISGEYISETILLKGKTFCSEGFRSYYKKQTKLIYILDTETTKNFDQIYSIHKFKVIE